MRKINTQRFSWYLIVAACLDIKSFPMRVVRSIKQTLHFAAEHQQYTKAIRKAGDRSPVFLFGQLHDRTSVTGFDQQYVYQSWWAFSHIRNDQPAEHVDVGSLIEFVGYISVLTKTMFIDIRPPHVNWPRLSRRK